MNTPKENELLIEAVAGAWRPRGRETLEFHPSWYDLDPKNREKAFKVTQQLRMMEAALHSDGLSTTARAVLSRIQEASKKTR